MKRFYYRLLIAIFIGCSFQVSAQYSPYLAPNVSLPIPNGKTLTFDVTMSDEFNYTGKPNMGKWELSDAPNTPYLWHGRFPGHFDSDAVTVSGGKLRIEASAKSKWLKDYDGTWKNFTHQGGLVHSKSTGSYGYYEAKIKANKTFMSSTFWLITAHCASGRGTELDILETFGVATQNSSGVKTVGMENFTKRMNSNTHAFGCPGRTNNHEVGAGTFLDPSRTAKTSDAEHIYAALWLNANKVIFYLDGEKIDEITPPNDFDMEMHLKMVVESYNWNLPKAGSDGMNASLADRTTTYDYVRVWKLDDAPAYFDGTDGLYTITTQNTNRNLEHGAGSSLFVNNIDVNSHAQQWEIKAVAGTPAYTIKSRSTGRYLEVPYAQCSANGADPVGTWTTSDWNHKKWIIESTIYDRVRIKPYHCQGKALTSTSVNPNNITITPNHPIHPDAQAAHRFYITVVPSNARTSMNALTLDDLEEEMYDKEFTATIFPNPITRNKFNVALLLSDNKTPVEVVLYDILGMVTYRNTYDNLPQGQSHLTIDLEGVLISNGMHILKVTQGKKEVTQTISISR